MDKEKIKKFKQVLEKEKIDLEEELKKFATKDDKMKGDWDTRFPKLDKNVSGSASLEAAADEVEEYSTLLPQEHSMEIKLTKIASALEKIDSEGYGICENCKKEIPIERLYVSPESKLCLDCEKNK
jgi:DnaK suppressor protein